MVIENKEADSKQKKIVLELKKLNEDLSVSKDDEEKKMINSQIKELKKILNDIGEKSLEKVEDKKSEPIKKERKVLWKRKDSKDREYVKKNKLDELEKISFKRLKEKPLKIKMVKEIKPDKYIKLSNNLFGDYSKKISKKEFFKTLERDLIQSKSKYILPAYVSMGMLSVLISFGFSLVLFLFLLFFDLNLTYPLVTLMKENILLRIVKIFWVLILIPLGTGGFIYLYPSLEKKSIEAKINRELPFATIHMSAISGSMIDPTKIFKIMIATKEYPNLEKDFTRLLNEINLYGYDLVTALRNVAMNSPSQKLAELFNGLSTNITSGGNLTDFFDKRSQTLLFEHRIETEKESKSAETFMDIYISVVIAAPMILMLLLVMMRISGLGISLSTGMITTIMVSGVTMINIVFLGYLYLKKGVSD